MPDDKWRHIVEDFAATFSITRHSILESFVFYLLDDHTDEALQVIFVLSVTCLSTSSYSFSFALLIQIPNICGSVLCSFLIYLGSCLIGQIYD